MQPDTLLQAPFALNSVCVYCSSADGLNPAYTTAAHGTLCPLLRGSADLCVQSWRPR